MLTTIILGLINICIVVAILLLVGYIVLWILGIIGFSVPDPVQKLFMAIVALVALYMIVALLLGAPTWRILSNSQVPPIKGTIASPPPIMKLGAL